MSSDRSQMTPSDSGERELQGCPICERPLCRTALGDSADHEQRAACYMRGYMRLLDERAWHADAVPVPRPLAQRILAALELTARFVDSNAMALADELRKEMGK